GTVFEHLALQEDCDLRRSSLYSCLFVNRTWFGATRPVLYRAPSIPTTARYLNFYNTITSHPEYAALVRELVTFNHDIPLGRIPWCCSRMEVLDLRNLVDCDTQRADTQKLIQWCHSNGGNLRALGIGHVAAQDAITIARSCRRLRHLAIGTDASQH